MYDPAVAVEEVSFRGMAVTGDGEVVLVVVVARTDPLCKLSFKTNFSRGLRCDDGAAVLVAVVVPPAPPVPVVSDVAVLDPVYSKPSDTFG